MKRIYRIYKTLLHLNLSTLMAYRANLVNSIIASVGWGVFSIVMIFLLTNKSTAIYGWTRDEIFLLTGFYNIIGGSFHVLFSRNFERFARVMHMGELDMLLLKPVDSQFLLSFWMFNYVGLFRIVLGILFSGYIVFKLEGTIPFTFIPLAVVLSVAGLIFLYSISYILLTMTMWNTNLSNLVGLMYEMNGLTRYPPEIFTQFRNVIVFLILPLTLVVSIPVKSILGKANISDCLLLLSFAILFLLFSRMVWRYALRSYTSAS